MKKSTIKNIMKVSFAIILLSFFGLKSKAASNDQAPSNQTVEVTVAID